MSNRQRAFFLPVDPMDKERKDPETIDLKAPRLALYKQKLWKKHQNRVYWVDINLAQKKGLKFCQTRSNAIILHETLPVYCIPKVVRTETGEIIYENVCMSPRPPPQNNQKGKLFDNQKEKLLDKQKAPNLPNQIQIMIERGDPLSLDNQPARPHRSTRCTLTSEYLYCHIHL